MGLFDLFRGREAAQPAVRSEPPVVAATAEPVQSESQWKGGMVLGGHSRAGVRVNETTALSVPATLQAIRILSGVFAMTPLHLYRRVSEDVRERVSGGAADLMDRAPNQHQTPFQFRELVMMDLLLSGNFFARVHRDIAGRPVALTRLKPGTVLLAEVYDDAEGIILFYDATLPDGTRRRFAGRDIFHLAGMTRDGLQGLNPIHFARDAIGGAIATSDHAARFWGKGGRPGTVLTSKQTIGPKEKEMVRRDWGRIYSGPEGEQIAVLDQDLTATFLTHDLQSSQFVETRGFQVMDLARVWGVPPHLLMDLSKATFGNIEQQSLEFVTYHMGPHFVRFAQAVTRAFAGPDQYFEHLTDALVRGDLKSRMEAYWQQRQMGVVSANELRRRENLPPLPGAAGDEYWRPGNMQIAGAPPAADATAAGGDD